MSDSQRCIRVDLHTHILPKVWPNWNERFGYDGWLMIEHTVDGTARMLNSDGSLFRVVEENCFSPAKRVEECDDRNVSVQVLSTVPGIGFNYHVPAADANVVAMFLNDHIAECVREYPKRFLGIGTVPLQDTDMAIAEMRRCLSELGMVGLQIGTHIPGKNLEAPELEPFWAEVEALNCPIFIHPWYMSTEDRLKKHWFQWTLGMPHETAMGASSLIFGGVLDRYPNLRICLAHGGGSFPGVLGRLTHAFNCRPDLCQTCNTKTPTSFLNQIYLDSLVHDPDALKFNVSKVGTDRIIMGTDYPFPLGEIDRPGGIIEDVYGDDQEVFEKLMWKNAFRFLGIKEDHFS